MGLKDKKAGPQYDGLLSLCWRDPLFVATLAICLVLYIE